MPEVTRLLGAAAAGDRKAAAGAVLYVVIRASGVG
jgi:hypothetical protein